MLRLALLVVTAAFLFVATPVAPASPPTAVTIVGDIEFSPGPVIGTFTAEGSVCSAGEIANVGTLFVGFQSGRGAQILVRHEFRCADGSGSFVLQLTVRLEFQEFTTAFTWSVLSGTGDYAKLHGSGTGSGTPTPGGIRDTYTGVMHID